MGSHHFGPRSSSSSRRHERELFSSEDDELDGRACGHNPVSPVSLESPAVGSLSSPGSMGDPEQAEFAKAAKGRDSPAERIRPYHPQNGSNGAIGPKSQMELKLVQELKAHKEAGGAEDKVDEDSAAENKNPAAQLVTELFESLQAKSSSQGQRKATSPLLEKQQLVTEEPIDFKANLKKTKKAENKPVDEGGASESHIVDFKSTLKKTGQKNLNDRKKSEDESPAIVDFKAKLKKPKAEMTTEKAEEINAERSDHQVDFKARLRKVSGNKPVVTVSASAKTSAVAESKDPEDSEDKRKSTGSISSLRKMWEGPKSPTEENGSGQGTVKFEKRVWPPVPSTETEKPMVPVKPTMKSEAPAKPAKPPPTTKPPPPKEKPPKISVKPNVASNIYAAPLSTNQKKLSKTTSKGSTDMASSGDSGIGSTSGPDPRSSILVSSKSLEEILSKAKDTNNLGTVEMMQLSEKVKTDSIVTNDY